MTVFGSAISDSALVLVVIIVAYVGLAAYSYGKNKARVYQVPRTGYQTPNLAQLVVRAKYSVKGKDLDQVYDALQRALTHEFKVVEFSGERHGNTMTFTRTLLASRTILSSRWPLKKSHTEEYLVKLAQTRSGIPMELVMVGNDIGNDTIELDLTVTPVLYRQVTQLGRLECTDQDIQASQHECMTFARQIAGVLEATELEPPSVRPSPTRTDVGKRLIMFGMSPQADLLLQAQAKIAGGQPEDGVKNCRSAVEQVLENLMMRAGLDRTDSFKHNLDRLVHNKYLDAWVSTSIYDFYYRLVSQDVHDKYKPGHREARYILDVTEDTIEFLLNRLA